ncbi:unnamed protein product, partial [Rotaria magnacalcarata]
QCLKRCWKFKSYFIHCIANQKQPKLNDSIGTHIHSYRIQYSCYTMALITKFLCLLFIVVLVAAYNTVEAAADAPDDSQDAESNLDLQNQDDSIAEAILIH